MQKFMYPPPLSGYKEFHASCSPSYPCRRDGETGRYSLTSCCPLLCVHAQLLSCVQIFAIPWAVIYQAPLAVGFSRQEYWSGLPFPTPGDLPDPRIEPGSPALRQILHKSPLHHTSNFSVAQRLKTSKPLLVISRNTNRAMTEGERP